MNIKGKGKSKSDKAESKAIIGIVLAAIMLASVFAGISASAIADDNNTDNESVDVNDSGVVESQVEEEAVGASEHGSVTVIRAPDSPSRNIANTTANYTRILTLRFQASGESANISKLTITQDGTIASAGITGWGVNDTDDETVLGKKTTGTFGELTLDSPAQVALATTKDLHVWVNTTNVSFDLGDSIILNLTAFNASGLASGEEVDKSGTPVVSHTIYGAGSLNLTEGSNDVADGRYVDAGANTTGVNTTGIVLMQFNLNATREECTVKNVTLQWNGSANATKDIASVYLINDTNSNGVWNYTTAEGDEKITSDATFDSAGYATLEILGTAPDSAKTIGEDKNINYLVVVNTTKYFWSGENLSVNVTDFNATGEHGPLVGRYVDGQDIDNNPLLSNVTNGQAKIIVTAGENQPGFVTDSTYYVKEGVHKNLENLQLNFTAIAGRVNITHIMLDQKSTAAGSKNVTYPKIYWDKDKDGMLTSNDTALNTTAGDFYTAVNVTLGNYSEDGGAVLNFTDYLGGAKLVQSVSPIYAYIQDINNVTDEYWWYNVSIEYINETGTNTTYFNVTNETAGSFGVGYANPTEAIGTYNPLEIGNDKVYDITNITFAANKSVITYDLDIIAPIGCTHLNITNLTIGNETETDEGQESKYVILAVQTTDEFDSSSNTTRVMINTTDTYGNWSNYIGWGTNTRRQIYDSGEPTYTATTAREFTPYPVDPAINVSIGPNPPSANVGLGESLVPVLQLNFTWGGGAVAALIQNIVVSENGTGDMTGNLTAVGLVYDADGDGLRDADEPLIAGTGRTGIDVFKTDNGTIKLTPTAAIELNDTVHFKNILVVVNASSSSLNVSDPESNSIRFNISNPSMDYNAKTSYKSTVLTDYNISAEWTTGIELYPVGAITASRGAATPADGRVSSTVNSTRFVLMQVNFTASNIEAVNITNVSVTWNGTGKGNEKTSSVGMINDTNFNGVYDADVDEVLNVSTFYENDNVTWLNLSCDHKNLTIAKGATVSTLIYVNTSTTGAGRLNASDIVAVNISNPYTSYNATGLSSGQNITDYSTTRINSATKTASFTGLIETSSVNLTTTRYWQGDRTNVAMLCLNFTAWNETVNITSVKITASGTTNEKNNITGVFLANDTNKDGAYTGVDTVLTTTTQNFTMQDGNVTLTPDTPVTVRGMGPDKNNSVYILVVGDVSNNSKPWENIKLELANPSTDYTAVGYYANTSVYEDSTDSRNATVYITGESAASKGTNTTATGALTVGQHTNVSLLQLNFTAKYESTNITAINITELGTANGTANITNIGVVNDTNSDGIIDVDDSVMNATATFNMDNGVANITLDPVLNITNNSHANMIIYVNTSSDFTFGQTLKVGLLNTTVNYTAYGVASGQLITDNSTAVDINSNVLTGTGNLTIATDANDTAAVDTFNISTTTTDIVVWQLNISAELEGVTLDNIALTENGTAHGVNDIDAVKLYYDADKNGTIDAGESSIASGTLSADNGTVTFSSLAQAIANNASKNYLVAVDINTSGFYDGDTLAFNLTNTSVNATGENSSVAVYNNFTTQNSSVTPAVTGIGTIELVAGANQPLTVTNTTVNFTSILQLKFTAANGAIDIANITVKENGTAVNGTDFTLLSVIDDADNDGVYDTGETKYNTTAALSDDNGTARIEVPNLYVDGTKNVLITINTTTPTTDRTLVFEVNQTLGVGYNATGNVSLQTSYSTKNVTSPGTTISNSITIVAGFPITLGNGWNLISTPLMPTNNAMSTVISDISSNLESVWAYRYNETAGNFEWLVHTPGAGYDTLNYMDAGWGYWMNMNNADTLVIDGTFFPTGEEVPPTYKVYEGWNLIGFHSLTNKNASVYLANLKDSSGAATWSTLYRYPHGGPYDQITADEQMTRGDGHWVSMRADGTIIP